VCGRGDASKGKLGEKMNTLIRGAFDKGEEDALSNAYVTIGLEGAAEYCGLHTRNLKDLGRG